MPSTAQPPAHFLATPLIPWKTRSPPVCAPCVILTTSQVPQAAKPRLLLPLTSASAVVSLLPFVWTQAGLRPSEDTQGHLRSWPPGACVPSLTAHVKHAGKGREVVADGSTSVKAPGAASRARGSPRPGFRTRLYCVTLREEGQAGGHSLRAWSHLRPGCPHTPRRPLGFFHGLLTTSTQQGSCVATDPGACYSRTIPKPSHIISRRGVVRGWLQH